MQQVHAVPRSDKFKFHHHTLLPEVVLFFDLYFFTETKKRCILKPIYFMTQFLPSVRSFVRAFVCLSVRLSIRPYPYYFRNFKESIVPLRQPTMRMINVVLFVYAFIRWPILSTRYSMALLLLLSAHRFVENIIVHTPQWVKVISCHFKCTFSPENSTTFIIIFFVLMLNGV